MFGILSKLMRLGQNHQSREDVAKEVVEALGSLLEQTRRGQA
jgi:hypothetical protein